MTVDETALPGNPATMTGALLEDLRELRHDLHRHPELRFSEHRTSRILADRLRDAGFRVRTGFAETGVLGTWDSGRPGRHVVLRADMDALPTTDLTGTPYASQNAGVCHACGHDVHCVVVLGAALLLKATGLAAGGQLSVLYQPAEEIPAGESSGAQAVLDSGVLDELGEVTTVLGLHCWPQLSAGTIGVDPVIAMAAKLAFRIGLSGQGAHAATPHLGRDALLAASQLTLALHTLIGRRAAASDRAALNIGTLWAGTSQSIVPPAAELTGTIRSVDDQVAERLRTAVEQAAAGVGATSGVDAEVEWKNAMPAVRNDPRLVRLALRELGGAAHVQDVVSLSDPPMTTDDFALYARRWPALYLKLGVAAPGAQSWPSLHDGRFDVDEACIATGSQAVATLAAAVLAGGLDGDPAEPPGDDSGPRKELAAEEAL
jgi:amidohydrolase